MTGTFWPEQGLSVLLHPRRKLDCDGGVVECHGVCCCVCRLPSVPVSLMWVSPGPSLGEVTEASKMDCQVCLPTSHPQ